jgi:hypothetical protein
LNQRFSEIAAMIRDLATVVQHQNESIAMHSLQIERNTELIARNSEQIAELRAAVTSLVAAVEGRSPNRH